MTIAIDIRALSQQIGGVAEYTRNIVRSLIETEQTHTYVLFTNSWKGIASFGFPSDGPRHSTVYCRYPNKLFHAAQLFFHRPRLDALIEKKIGKKPDLFFFPNIHFAALSDRTPSVLTLHDLSFMIHPELLSMKSYWWHMLIRPYSFIAAARHILAASGCTKQDCVALCKKNAEHITVTYQDCDPTFRKIPRHECIPLGERRNIILFGVHELRKNAPGALEAFALVLRRNKSAYRYTLVLSGKKSALVTRLSRRIEELHVAANVVLLGPQSEDERHALYSSARLILYPSIYEGFGLHLIEAALYGVPIVSSARSSIGEIIKDGALLVDPCNIHDLVKAIEYALSDDTVGEQFALSASRQASEKFSWVHTAALTRSVFEKVYSEKHLCE